MSEFKDDLQCLIEAIVTEVSIGQYMKIMKRWLEIVENNKDVSS